MQAKWKKAFLAATISVAAGIILMAVSFFAVEGDMDHLSWGVFIDENTFTVPDAPEAPKAPNL